MSPLIQDYFQYAWQMFNSRRALHEQRNATERWRDVAPYIDQNRPLQILDLANGRLRPQYALLKAEGHHVYGIDLVNDHKSNWFSFGYKVARVLYRRQIGWAGEPSDSRTLICGDVNKLPFPDNFFDLATSVAAFEHFLDVPRVVAELERTLRSGGVVWVRIHLFTSLSGGHNTSFAEIPLRSLPTDVEPWDHLRMRAEPFHVPLNKWRKEQYLDEFRQHFEILKHYCAIREGKDFLTPTLRAQLKDYSLDELTCRAFVIVARKG